ISLLNNMPWGAAFTLADVDGDTYSDLVFHSWEWGGDYTTNLYMLRGQGNGTFAPVAEQQLLLTSPYGASQAVFGDFNEDGALDVFLPPDDDVSDMGQAHIAFNNGSGVFGSPQESIDFRPDNESYTSDEFLAFAETYDVNLDGYLDIVGRLSPMDGSGNYSTAVYWGDGTGQFSVQGDELFSVAASEPYKPVLTPLVFTPQVLETPGDTISTALDSRLSSANPGTFSLMSEIGDNPNVAPASDVDFIEFQLNAGDRVTIDIDADEFGSSLDSVVRLFDSAGNELTFSDDHPAPGEAASYDSYIDFTASLSDTYYLGVSSYSNFSYDPLVAGSGSGYSTGEYELTIAVIPTPLL
ncbi:MAG: FG-GAP-like repeat-containing protein, partial [Coleofasciculus sp. S288]|nr:FG-GAP-like repeat-containing protein [Coleofasciculus sp. S288]